MDEKINLLDYIHIAYKKLKANMYFDKTQLPLRNMIVDFESEKIDKAFKKIHKKLQTGDGWEKYEDDLLKKIGVLVYPKKLEDINHPLNTNEASIVFNKGNHPLRLEKPQYFIDLPVEGHILGVLWILTIGVKLDSRNDDSLASMYEHSYGNRLRKTLINAETQTITQSPNLFEPYFSQYESWRDKALDHAKRRLEDRQDAIILTLDFQSFFYSVDVDKMAYDKLLDDFGNQLNWVVRVHNFVYKVLQTYSRTLRKINTDSELELKKRTLLPIGFLPSNILSNWILTPFDNEIIKRWNPVYYGRYVDDIIIVDKIEKNSPLYKLASNQVETLTSRKVIDYYFRSCPADRKESSFICSSELFLESRESGTEKIIYSLSPHILHSQKSKIRVQNDKVKIFYFREGATTALLECFRTKISKNASEFRHLPDINQTFNNNDYSEIFNLNSNESIHKLRGVIGVSLDKFSLSKFLGKYRKAGNMIRDRKETSFDQELLSIFDKHALIENYTLWERLLEIMIVNERLENYEKLVIGILNAIESLEIPGRLVKEDASNKWKGALLRTLHAAICRTSAISWGNAIDKILLNIDSTISKMSIASCETIFDQATTKIYRQNYCRTRMINKYVLPLPIDCIDVDQIFDNNPSVSLNKLANAMKYIKQEWSNSSYKWYPYMITPQELAFSLACEDINQEKIIADPAKQKESIKEKYLNWNYPEMININRQNFIHEKVKALELNKFVHNPKIKCFVTSIDTDIASQLKVAIGNARINFKDFEGALTENPNRSYTRYQQLYELLFAAVKEHVELLVLPENYLPWEWLPDVARICANNQLALVTGIEHIISPKKDKWSTEQRTVYNLTAVILPYTQDDYKYADITFHQKTHYSPEEKRLIAGHCLNYKEGNVYHLFHWKGTWFSVYCCFELASIEGRALFQSFADLTIAVEWNKDVAYFSNIVESLCRDLHCYCIQSNSSDYGDSRVMSPSSSVKRDLIKTKGGHNSIILVDKIDIHSLRNFQRKEYELQRQDDTFKTTPPNFNRNIVILKQKGTLWNYLKEHY